MESVDSSTCPQQQPQPQLPPGFRFHPTDEELVVHYLKKRVASVPLPVSIIAEVDLYKFDPWELPAKATFGEQEWYFFSPRDRKYPNGIRPNRAATSGYWKATGTDKPVLTSGGTQKVGVKKALVFYGGKPPKGVKTNWIMHEYRLLNSNKNTTLPAGNDVANRKGSLRLDDWVLCRIYKKNNTQRPSDHDRDDMNDVTASISPSILPSLPIGQPKFPGLFKPSSFGHAFLENDQNLFEGMISASTTNGTTSDQLASTDHLRLPAKRMLSGSLYDDNTDSLPTKRIFDGNNDENVARTEDHQNNSIVTYLSQLPQTPSLHQQTLLGSMTGDGVFRQPYQVNGMNWYT